MVCEVSYEFSAHQKSTTDLPQRTTGLATRVVCTAYLGVSIMHVNGSAEICVEPSDCYVLIRCESTEKPKVSKCRTE